ncbi:MAG: peptidylprolyl isomerase [Clostridia bacterium]|nr:peptidylprolyl isomerase [Clostridia bacterium]MBQ6123519.1 peptidylprolyl isomerase [Clostridia bacterium]
MKSALCFLLVMLLSLCPALAEAADDPVVVRVGDVTFTKARLQSEVDINVTVSELMEQEFVTDEERQARRDEAIQGCIQEGLIEMKLREAGKNDFTAEEEETLRATALSQYETIWQGIWEKAKQSNQGFTEEQVTEFLNEQGYSSEAIFEALKANERLHRAVELFCPDITLTADMVEKYYEAQFLLPDRERYEKDLDLYEQEILAGNNESFYTPEGYRAIKQVLLAYPGEIDKALRNENARVNIALQAVAEAASEVSEAALTGDSWDDVAGPRAEYDAAVNELTAAKQAYNEKRERLTLPLIRDTVEAINAEIDAGIDIDSVINKYSTDKNEQNLDKGGYPVHPDSKNWPPEFLEAAGKLEKPGDLSGPVLTDMGIHILYYAADIPAGPHELTDEERQLLNASALYYYQTQALEKLVADWTDEYEIETHPELLVD